MSADFFLRHLSKGNKLTENRKEMLRLLSCYSPLPLSVVTGYCKSDAVTINNELSYLLDYAFVLPDGTNFRISEPIRDAAYRAFGGLSVNHTLVASLIEEYLEEEKGDEQRLSLGQTLFRATLLGGSTGSSRFAVKFASDYIKVATQSYHNKEYDLTIKYGEVAVRMRPTNVDLRRFVAQALIRKERYDDAVKHINALQEAGNLKEAYFVRGFMARRQHNYQIATDNYEKSLSYGRGGSAIYRELASCYFERGEPDKADYYIKEAEAKSSHNKFIVDLRCTIAIRLGHLDEVEPLLAILERIDDDGFVEHRRSTYEQARGHEVEALRLAQTAIEKMPAPPFEVIANLANCYIEAGSSAAALDTFRTLERRFGGTRHDARVGLRCKYEIRFGDIAAAEGLWNTLRDKHTPVARGLRLAILNRKLSLGLLSADEEVEHKRLLLKQDRADADRMALLVGSLLSRGD